MRPQSAVQRIIYVRFSKHVASQSAAMYVGILCIARIGHVKVAITANVFLSAVVWVLFACLILTLLLTTEFGSNIRALHANAV